MDYRALDSLTFKDSYPLSQVDDTQVALVGVEWLSTLNMKSRYHQVKKGKKKTAFYCQGLWQFKVMPFGLCKAPETRAADERMLGGLQWKTTLLYLDDVIVFCQTFDREFERLSKVFALLRTANLKVSSQKCCLFQKEVQHLGHLVSVDEMQTDPEKVAAVKDCPGPPNVKEL